MTSASFTSPKPMPLGMMRCGMNSTRKNATIPMSAFAMIVVVSLVDVVTARVATGSRTSENPRNGNTILSGMRYTCRSITDTASSIEETSRYGTTTHHRWNECATSAHRMPLTTETAWRCRPSGCLSGGMRSITCVTSSGPARTPSTAQATTGAASITSPYRARVC